MRSTQQSFIGMPAIIASRPMRELYATIERVARSNASILIQGESGSGKELAARAVHHFSARSSSPWVDLNCAALPESLLESELFGYEKGAFTGANLPKPGLFELADGGTIFLDEIADLDLRMQAKLLRVLDGAPFYRLGGTRKVVVDVRIVAASNQDIYAAVQKGRFREDLFHRLAQFQITVPPLRDRLEDIVPLAELFLRQQQLDVTLTEDAKRALESYNWPRNIRELRNVVMQCTLSTAGGEIRTLDLPERLQDSYAVLPPGESDLKRLYLAVNDGLSELGINEEPIPAIAQGAMLQNMERHLILRVLEHTGGHQERASQLLGISRRTLSRKLKIYSEGEPAATAMQEG